MTAQQLWEAALGQLELRMTKPTFNTWIKPTSALTYEDGTLIVSVPNAYTKDWLENRLLPVVKRTLAHIAFRTVEVRFTLHQSHQVPASSGLFAPDGLRPPTLERSATLTLPQPTAPPPGDGQRRTPMFN